MNNLNCKDMELKIFDYVSGELRETEKAELEAHLSECTGCREELEKIKLVQEVLSECRLTPPAGFADTVIEKINRNKRKRANIMRALRGAAIAACFLFVFVVPALFWSPLKNYDSGNDISHTEYFSKIGGADFCPEDTCFTPSFDCLFDSNNYLITEHKSYDKDTCASSAMTDHDPSCSTKDVSGNNTSSETRSPSSTDKKEESGTNETNGLPILNGKLNKSDFIYYCYANEIPINLPTSSSVVDFDKYTLYIFSYTLFRKDEFYNLEIYTNSYSLSSKYVMIIVLK